MTDPTPMDEERRHTEITDGVAKAMVRYGAARQCPGCGFGVPKYPGRYQRFCPRCGDEMQMPKEEKARKKANESVEAPIVVCASRAARVQRIIESGQQSFASYLNDPSCSRAVSVPFAALQEHGGADGVRAFFEGPATNGLYYRIEDYADPVIVADFDNRNAKMRLFSTTNPRRYLSSDPREDFVVEDHEATFEGPLSEGLLKDVADKALGFLSERLGKLWKMFGTLRQVKLIWEEAQRTSGVKIPLTPTLRMARGLDNEMQTALAGLKEGWTPRRAPVPPLAESVSVASALGFGLAVVGGMPLLFRGIARAAKWLNFPSIQRAFARAAHVAEAIENSVIDVAIPAELSYAVYTALWKRGWRVSSTMDRKLAARAERDAPLSFDAYVNDSDFQGAVESGMWRLLLLFFFVNGAMHILAAPLNALFASEAAATTTKGVEIGQGLQRAVLLARAQAPRMARMALESINPENVRMVVAGPGEHLDAYHAAAMQLFLREDDARNAATRLKLALKPVACLFGESRMWVLQHERTGYALGKGEVARLDEYFGSGPGSPSYNVAVRTPEQVRARQRAVDKGHDRVAGEFHEDKRASARRPRKPGEGPTQVRGGFRIHVGRNEKRSVKKDAEKALQNKMNAKRGLRARITGAKKWHRSREGQQLHAALGNYNRESHDAELRAKIVDVQDRIAKYSAGQQRSPVSPHTIGEDIGTLRPRSATGGTDQMTARGPQSLDQPLPDDHLEAILRRLIVTQNMDVLQDVEFDEDTGSIYLFFDPVLMPDEVQEVLAAIRQERGEIQLIASPTMSLPGESVESEWWVLFLPGPNETAIPDPSVYARNPEDYATKVQAVVMAPPNAPEAVAQGIDLNQMLQAAEGASS